MFSFRMPVGKYFTIQNFQTNLVLTIPQKCRSGHRVLLSDLSSTADQLWFYDQATFTIRNKANNFCLDIDGEIFMIY